MFSKLVTWYVAQVVKLVVDDDTGESILQKPQIVVDVDILVEQLDEFFFNFQLKLFNFEIEVALENTEVSTT